MNVFMCIKYANLCMRVKPRIVFLGFSYMGVKSMLGD
jgi:hypothetical protein